MPLKYPLQYPESASMCQSLFGTEPVKPERPGKLANSIPNRDSAIGNHLLHNQKCASHLKDNQFFILSKARSDFHLSVLESIFITLRKPNLCRLICVDTIRTINFLFSLKHDPISIYQSWNQFSSLFENLICVDQRFSNCVPQNTCAPRAYVECSAHSRNWRRTRGLIVPPKIPRFGQNSNFVRSDKKIFGRNQNFSGSDMKILGKVRNFRAVSIINCKK